MFSTKKQLIKRTGKSGVGRFSFLQQLVNEYNNTKSKDAKEQVLANLANFAYDPVNYDYLWRLRVLDLFFSALNEKNKKLVAFGIGGICNICLEPLSKEYIIKSDKIKNISSLLSQGEESIILSAITTLIYLHDSNLPEIKQSIASDQNIELMLKCSRSANLRIKNLAKIFLQDLCEMKVDDSKPTAGTSTGSNITLLETLDKPSIDTNICEKSQIIEKKKSTKTPKIVMNIN